MTPDEKNQLIRKFEALYVPDPNSGCWLWIGYCISTGYGQITAGYYRRVLAHRLSYELFVGPLPSSMQVRHKCDTRVCVNPDHLLIGTDQDNRSDMARRGRGSKGPYPVGVSPHRKKFQAKVKFHGSYINLGVFETVELASAAVMEKRQELYG